MRGISARTLALWTQVIVVQSMENISSMFNIGLIVVVTVVVSFSNMFLTAVNIVYLIIFALCGSRLLDVAQISLDLLYVALVSSMSLGFRSICFMWLSSPRCRSDFARFALCANVVLVSSMSLRFRSICSMWLSSP